jgi:hypothetical protein
MKHLFLGLVLCCSVTGLCAAETSPHLDDSGQLMSFEPKWTKACEGQLTAYEQATGIKILVQFHLKSPTAEEDKKPGAYMHALARKLGVDRGGVLVVYFNDDPDWRVWIGDGLTNRFTGKPGSVEELTASGAIHEVKEAMLTAARSKAEAAVDQAKKSAPAGKPLTTAQHLAFEADALLEALKAKFAPK